MPDYASAIPENFLSGRSDANLALLHCMAYLSGYQLGFLICSGIGLF